MKNLLALSLLLLSIGAGGCRNVSLTGEVVAQAQGAPADVVALPNKEGSFKFAVLGDFGTGTKAQYELAEQMVTLHDRFKYNVVVLVGDNLGESGP